MLSFLFQNGKTALLMAIRAENITITDMIIKAERYYEGVSYAIGLEQQRTVLCYSYVT